MRVQLVAGPAGSGKTFRCLAEIRQALLDAPDGPPLLFVAPKQSTYQLERQLLSDPDLAGFTRLRIVSFERLAEFVLSHSPIGTADILDEHGRLMILRALLARRRDDFKLFRASARLNGFAQQLSLLLREFQRNQVSPEVLAAISEKSSNNPTLASKLHDLSVILRDYLEWSAQQGWHDVDFLFTQAARHMEAAAANKAVFPRIAGLWVDGFIDWSEQELELLIALIPHCDKATVTFCLNELLPAGQDASWLSMWRSAQRAFERCRKRIQEVPGVEISVTWLGRDSSRSRFSENAILAELEEFWDRAFDKNSQESPLTLPAPVAVKNKKKQSHQPDQLALPLTIKSRVSVVETRPQSGWSKEQLSQSLRAVKCSDPETEATVAAHEILQFVRHGGRYREAAIIVRDLERYHSTVQHVFARCGIPAFLDRREPVSHHPLAELTRNALRTVAFDWRETDWFAALKTGLLPATDDEIDELENEAMARGWQGRAWREPLRLGEIPNRPRETARLKELETRLERLRLRILPPFEKLAATAQSHRYRLTGFQLAEAIRELWGNLPVEQRLQEWTTPEAETVSGNAPDSIHATVWEQINNWLTNVELAFPNEALSLREWLPILETGLSGLTVGLIPPALDQVTIGTIERSRNPEVRLAIVLGLNEGIFPEMPANSGLLSDGDRHDLAKYDLPGNLTARQRLSRERFLAYLAFTRARERLVITCALHDSDAKALNPSPFLDQLLRLFPALEVESVTPELDWRESQAPHEMVEPLLLVEHYRRELGNDLAKAEPVIQSALQNWQRLSGLPPLRAVLQALRHFDQGPASESILPAIAEELYGPILKTSVSRMEQFAACPFKFFVHSGLRAESRDRFELDIREQGSFQHDALAAFHARLKSDGKRWRDISPAQARQVMAEEAQKLAQTYRDGLMQSTERSRFKARALAEALQNFIERLIGWMGSQYQFDPIAVELPFGQDESSPAWELPIDADHRIAIYGRIDRVDIHKSPDSDQAFCVVVDYKSSQRTLDPVLMAHGAQLQLLTYLSVLRNWKNPETVFTARQLVPAGVFYVNLTAHFPGSDNRDAADASAERNRNSAYRHSGRFDSKFLKLLDARTGVSIGDQFNYRLKKDGTPVKNCSDIMDSIAFGELLDSIEASLKIMGEKIYTGSASISPYQKGKAIACAHCDYHGICRIDPWTHQFRMLRGKP